MENSDKFRINEYLNSTGILERTYRGSQYEYFSSREDDKLRVVVEGTGATNQVTIRARIEGATDYDVIAIINGPGSRVISVNTYDEIQFETTLFDAPSGRFKLIASGFSIAGGDIEVSTPAGVSIPGTTSLEFTSSDSTVTITGDGVNIVDFSAPALVGANFKPNVVYTLTSTDIINKQVSLAAIPANPNITQLFVISGGIMEYGADFIVAGSTLSWSGLNIDGMLETGEKIVIMHD